MNKQELIKKYKRLEGVWDAEGAEIARRIFLQDLEQLDEPEKPTRLKDVIKRIKGFDDETKFKWTYDILKELGSDFGSKIFHEAYQQGRFDEGIEAHHGREKVKIPSVVADWYEENKDDFEGNLFRCIYEIYKKRNDNELTKFEEWVIDDKTKPFQTLVNMHQFGYEVEKRYLVTIKGIVSNFMVLKHNINEDTWYMSNKINYTDLKAYHTKKELEDAGFGWVFDCDGIEVEEVTE